MLSRPVLDWFEANDLPNNIPDDAEVTVDEQSGTLTVEEFLLGDNGRPCLHARQVLRHPVTHPLKVPPPPGLLDAYQRTVSALRRERDAAEAIRQETARTIVDHIARQARKRLAAADQTGDTAQQALERAFAYGRLAAAEEDVWDALRMPRPYGERPGVHNVDVFPGEPHPFRCDRCHTDGYAVPVEARGLDGLVMLGEEVVCDCQDRSVNAASE